MFLCAPVKERASRKVREGVGGSRAPPQNRPRVATRGGEDTETAVQADKSSLYESVVAACSQPEIMALKVKLGPLQASFAVDTGAAVNVLSERTYLALKRASRGGRYQLRPSDLNLCGVTADRLNILGLVSLPVSLERNTPVMRLDFYVTSNFSLPSDGLLGLSSLRSNRMVIHPDSNTVRFQGRCFKAMDQPVRLASPWERRGIPSKGRESVSPESVVHTVPTLSTVPVHGAGTTSLHGQPPTPADVCRGWKNVNAIVVGNDEIPQRTTMLVPESVPSATVGCDICLEGPAVPTRWDRVHP